MSSGASFSLIVNSLVTPSLPRRRGFPQGAPASPSLFNLFLDSLLDLLNSASDLKTFAYADDLACLARSAPALQAGLDAASRWASEWGMRFNVAKCAVLAPPDLTESVSSLTLADEVVPVVPSFRYLGIPRSATSLDYFALVDEKVSSLERSLRALQAAGTAWPPRSRLALLKTFSLSHLDFGGAILHLALTLFPSLSARAIDRLTAVHNSATRWVTGLTWRWGDPLAGSLTGLPPPALRLQQLALGLALHISEADSANPTFVTLSHFQSNADPSVLLPHPPPLTPPLFLLAFLPIHEAFLQHARDRIAAERPPLTRHAFVRELTLLHHERSKYITASRIPRSSRPTGSFDGVLDLPTSSDRRRAVLWRAGTWAIQQRLPCLGCGARFNRRCLSHLWLAAGAFDSDGKVSEGRLSAMQSAMEQELAEREARGATGKMDLMDYLVGHRRKDWREVGRTTLRVWEERMVALQELQKG
ncbi:hypothetical protein JCM5296_000376 [Sporobolomyces johnsonii]